MLNFSKVMLLSSFAVFLIFAAPNAFAQSFDESACLSLLSQSQVQSATGFDEKIDIRDINTDLATLNEDLSSGCMIIFENEDRTFSLSVMLTEFFTESDLQSKYGDMFSEVNQMGYEVQSGNNGPWIYHLVEINEKGMGSILTSVKDKIMIGINAPLTDFPVKSSALIEIVEILHSNIDEFKKSNNVPTIPDCPEGTKQVGNACMVLDPNDIEPTNVEPIEIITEHDQKIVELEQPPTSIETGKSLSPRKQVSQGVEPEAVACNEGLVLILRHNGSPACVTEKTAEIFEERGLGSISPPCCKPTTVSLATNFEECIAEGNPAMESYPRQCRTIDGKHFVESIPENKECEMSGGLWGTWGNSQSAKESCNLSTSDVGMECTDSSQCQSFCQAKEGSEINSESVGMCYGHELAICMQEVRNGLVQNEWCQ